MLSHRLYVPSLATAEAAPLLVLLHGCQQDADDFAAGTAMNQLAERDSLFVLYPQQARASNAFRCWNWFEPAHQRRDAGEPAALVELIRDVVQRQPIDASRVFVAGLSAGAAMAAVLGATYPDLFAAVGAHSGLAYMAASSSRSAWKAMRAGRGAPRSHTAGTGVAGSAVPPLIVFHGDLDETVSPANADALVDQWLRLGPSAAQSLGVTDALVESPSTNADIYPATRRRYTTAEGATRVERWLVHGLGHAWSGGSRRGSFTDPNGPSASEAMLRFFAEHQREARVAGGSAWPGTL